MTLRTRGEHRYGDRHLDIRKEIERYAKANTYRAHHFAEAICPRGKQPR